MSDLDLPYRDYRSSHFGEGEDYHRKFCENRYRAIIWQLEQHVLLDVVERHCRPISTARLLDFACGTGRVLSVLEDRVGESVGVDVAPSMLRVAEPLLCRSRLLCCDITRAADLDAERFDVITAFRFFPNAEPSLREEAMAKLATLLAPRGVLVVNNHLRCGSLSHALRRGLSRIGLLNSKRDTHCMTDAEAVGLATRHGLVLAEEHHLGLLPVLKERRPLLPDRLIRRAERVAARIDFLAPLASHKIYVLRHASASSEPGP